MNKQKLPVWFNGITYEEGDMIENPETNEKIQLNNLELSVYDFVMGSEMLIEMMGNKASNSHIKYRDEGLKWLQKSNPKIIKFINSN